MKRSYTSLIIIAILYLVISIALPIYIHDYLDDDILTKLIYIETEIFILVILYFAAKRNHMYWINYFDYKYYESLSSEEQELLCNDYFRNTSICLIVPLIIHGITLPINLPFIFDFTVFMASILLMVIRGYRVFRKMKEE